MGSNHEKNGVRKFCDTLTLNALYRKIIDQVHEGAQYLFTSMHCTVPPDLLPGV